MSWFNFGKKKSSSNSNIPPSNKEIQYYYKINCPQDNSAYQSVDYANNFAPMNICNSKKLELEQKKIQKELQKKLQKQQPYVRNPANNLAGFYSAGHDLQGNPVDRFGNIIPMTPYSNGGKIKRKYKKTRRLKKNIRRKTYKRF